MRRYSLYLIDHDVARNYFGKEEKLYRLFLDAENQLSPYRSVLLKQIDYITQEIPKSRIHETLVKEIGEQVNVDEKNQSYEISSGNHMTRAVLMVKEKYMNLYAEGTCEAETIFFEELRKIAPSFLAMDFQRDYYGWLNPIKQAKLV